MALRNLISKITGTTPRETPQEAELRPVLAAGDEARRNKNYDAALQEYRNGLETARAAQYLQGQEVFLSQIGSLQVERSDFEAAFATFTEALEIANQTGEPMRRARALVNLGAYHLTRGDLPLAQKLLEQALELARPTGDASTIGLALGNLADVYLKEDNPNYAIRLLKEAVVLTQAAQNTTQAAYIIGLMGQAHLAINDYERGRRFLTQSIRLAQQYDQIDQEIMWSSMLADNLYKAGQIEEARQLYARCEELTTKAAKLPAGFALRNLVNEGSVYQKLNQPEKALDYTTRALEGARAAENSEIEALALVNLGGIQQDLKHIDEAVAALQGAIDLYGGRAKNDSERTNTLIVLGKLYEDQGQPQKALEIYQRSVDESGEENRLGRALALRRIGSALQISGDLPGALEKWTGALAIFEQTNETAQAARLLCDMGAARRSISGINAALPDYERATMLLSNVRDSGTRGVVLSNVANLYTDLGEVETAQSFYLESISLARQAGQQRAESLRLGNFAWFYTMTGQPDNAIRQLEQALLLSRHLKDQLLIAVQTNNMAQAYHELKDYKAAEGLYDQAINIAKTLPEPRWLAMFNSNLARTYLTQDRVNDALPLLEGALTTSRAVNDQETVARTLARLGDAYVRLERYPDAENVAREAENVARKWGYRKGQADALMIRANVAKAQNDPTTAEKLTREAYKLYSILHDPLAKELAQVMEA